MYNCPKCGGGRHYDDSEYAACDARAAEDALEEQGIELAELKQKLESTTRDLRRLMGHYSTVDIAAKAYESMILQLGEARKALWNILGTVQGSHPNPYKEIQAIARGALDAEPRVESAPSVCMNCSQPKVRGGYAYCHDCGHKLGRTSCKCTETREHATSMSDSKSVASSEKRLGECNCTLTENNLNGGCPVHDRKES